MAFGVATRAWEKTLVLRCHFGDLCLCLVVIPHMPTVNDRDLYKTICQIMELVLIPTSPRTCYVRNWPPVPGTDGTMVTVPRADLL